MKLAEIIEELERIAPPSLQEDYDNSGLIVGSADADIHKALLCLDSTEEVIDEAIREGCNLIVSHHPIVFRGLKRFSGSNYVERAVIKAIKNDIAIYACHTNLDNVLAHGVNSKIAGKLGLNHTRILRPGKGALVKLSVFVPLEQKESVLNALFEAGAGDIGNYSECSFSTVGTGTFRAGDHTNPFVGKKGERHYENEERLEVIFPVHLQNRVEQSLKSAHPYEEVAWDVYPLLNPWQEAGSGLIGELKQEISKEEFLEILKKEMQLPLIKYTRSNKSMVNKVAVCGGAGSFLISDALKSGADAFITSDIKYHEFFDADNNMILCDIGHFESEKYTTEIFSEILSLKFRNFATIFAKTLTNPVNYYF